MTNMYETKRLLEEMRGKKEKEEWLFAIAVVKAGLQHEGNFDDAAEHELAGALDEFNLTAEELEQYLEKNRKKLLRFLQSSRPQSI